jgi:hypothetical protein
MGQALDGTRAHRLGQATSDGLDLGADKSLRMGHSMWGRSFWLEEANVAGRTALLPSVAEIAAFSIVFLL